jgi:biopolymer transport protein ExbB
LIWYIDLFELLQTGGWLVVPILICSILATSIAIERLWALREERVAPRNLRGQVVAWMNNNEIDNERLEELKSGSYLGKLFCAGLASQHEGKNAMKENIEGMARQVVHDLERYLNTLGTVAVVAPLLGLLGTVVGMIKVFAVIQLEGTGDAMALAQGISEALITTAAGLSVAIPSLFCYRFLNGRVDALVIHMEQEALKLVDSVASKTTV